MYAQGSAGNSAGRWGLSEFYIGGAYMGGGSNSLENSPIDLDFEATANAPSEHTKITCEILGSKDLPPEALQAIREHNAEALGIPRESAFGIALACGETITGLIVATALVMPDKRVADVKVKSVRKRMRKKDFARAVNREIIGECERLGIPLDEFIPLCLEAMQGVSDALGL